MALSRLTSVISSTIEFEIKIMVDPNLYYDSTFSKDEFKTLILNFINIMINNDKNIIEVHNTINLIKTINKNTSELLESKYVDKSNLPNEISKRIKTIMKSKMEYHNITNIKYKMTMSKEIKINDNTMDINLINLVRGKSRISIFIDNDIMKNWRIDITFIKIMKITDNNFAQDIKTNLFKSYNANKLIQSINWDYISGVEIEIEYLKNVTPDMKINFMDQLNYLLGYFTNDDIKKKSFYNTMLNTISNIVGKISKNTSSFRYVLNNVKNLTTIVYYNSILEKIDNFFVTLKLDGERVLLIYKDTNLFKFDSNQYEKVDLDINDKSIDKFIFDCELYNNTFYVFDIIAYNNDFICRQPFVERLNKLITIINNINNKKILCKEYNKLNVNNYCDVIKNTYNNTKLDVDGLIFTSMNEEYKFTSNYKWKPVEFLTIDFLVVKCPDNKLNKYPYINKEGKILYLLFSAVNELMYNNYHLSKLDFYDNLFPKINKNYFPIQFSPMNFPFAYLFWSNKKDLHMKCVELVYDMKIGEWKFVKIRLDKVPSIENGYEIGNNYDIASEIWYNYNSPLTIEKLCLTKSNYDANNYFVNESDIQFAVRKYNRFITDNLLNPLFFNNNKKKYANDTVIDIGIGRGGDLVRYIKYRYKIIIGIDIDDAALKNLIMRYKKIMMKNKMNITKLYFSQFDISNNHDSKNVLLNSGIPIPDDGVDLVFCNFAFHYFMYNKESLDNVIYFISQVLKNSGRFIFTAFNGDKLNSIFNEKKTKVLKFKNSKGDIEYGIEKLYQQNVVKDLGQMIKVLHPFNLDTYYEEPLINIKIITKMFKKYKFTLINKNGTSFIDHYNDFINNANKNKWNTVVSDDEKEYISLYHYYIFQKDK